MNALRDFIDAIRIGIHAARQHLHTMRWLRAGGCPDNDPPSF